MQAVFDTMERFYDPHCRFHDEGDDDMMPSLCDNALFEMLSVTILSWGIAGSLLCKNAIIYTIYSAVPGWDDVEEDNGIVKDKDSIYVLWIAFLICIAITLAMTAYVGKLVTGIKNARRLLFDKLKRKETKEPTQSQISVDVKGHSPIPFVP